MERRDGAWPATRMLPYRTWARRRRQETNNQQLEGEQRTTNTEWPNDQGLWLRLRCSFKWNRARSRTALSCFRYRFYVFRVTHEIWSKINNWPYREREREREPIREEFPVPNPSTAAGKGPHIDSSIMKRVSFRLTGVKPPKMLAIIEERPAAGGEITMPIIKVWLKWFSLM